MLWSRLGAFDVRDLERLLWGDDRRLFEWDAFIWPLDDFALVKGRMLRHRSHPTRDRVETWLRTNAAATRYVLRELRARGPLLSSELEDRAVVPWDTSGPSANVWWGNRSVAQTLELLSVWDGKVMVAGRKRGQRLWDLAERALPDTVLRCRPAGAAAYDQRRLESLGIARPNFVPHAVGTRVRVEGVDGEWIASPEWLECLDDTFEPRTVLLSPFDRLIHDRARTEALFNFRYRLEIYTPKAKREFGYFVLPILDGETLAGRADIEFVRATKTLNVKQVWSEPGCELAADDLSNAFKSLADFVGATRLQAP